MSHPYTLKAVDCYGGIYWICLRIWHLVVNVVCCLCLQGLRFDLGLGCHDVNLCPGKNRFQLIPNLSQRSWLGLYALDAHELRWLNG